VGRVIQSYSIGAASPPPPGGPIQGQRTNDTQAKDERSE
jgi:hypothetical protein